jgi:cyclopropane fatty-acyl-phospholipid synthase-like methyltransferase
VSPPSGSHDAGRLGGLLELSFFHDIWQTVSGANHAKKAIVQDYLCPRDGMRLLDIGCGTGILLDDIPQRVDYVGYDINPDYIERARRKYGHRARFHCTSVNDADLPEVDFDAAVAIGILHHLDDQESERLVASARRCLKQDGFLVLAEPVWTAHQGRLEKFLMSKDRGRNIRDEPSYRKLLAPHFSRVESHVRSGLLFHPWTICITLSRNAERAPAGKA